MWNYAPLRFDWLCAHGFDGSEPALDSDALLFELCVHIYFCLEIFLIYILFQWHIHNIAKYWCLIMHTYRCRVSFIEWVYKEPKTLQYRIRFLY